MFSRNFFKRLLGQSSSDKCVEFCTLSSGISFFLKFEEKIQNFREIPNISIFVFSNKFLFEIRKIKILEHRT